MKKSLAVFVSAVALALVMFAPSKASAQVNIYIGPGYSHYGYGYAYPHYGYGYAYPHYGYGYGYHPHYGYGYGYGYYPGWRYRHWRRAWRRYGY
jgi:opacity protein-like surface antigen